MMQVRVFTLRFNPVTERFDDSAVSGFLVDKEVYSIHDHFFIKDDVPYLALLLRRRLKFRDDRANSAHMMSPAGVGGRRWLACKGEKQWHPHVRGFTGPAPSSIYPGSADLRSAAARRAVHGPRLAPYQTPPGPPGGGRPTGSRRSLWPLHGIYGTAGLKAG